MLETKEQKTLPFEESSQPLEEATKYQKRIDDLIEDAEIEAEMEAEKKIRSKNSRMFSISMIGIGLLALVYFQVNTQSPDESITKTVAKAPETAEERLAKQVPVVEDGSSASSLPIPQSANPVKPIKNPFIKEPKAKTPIPPVEPPPVKKVKKAPLKEKIMSAPKSRPKSKPQKPAPALKSESSKFYIQVGAFGVKQNADKLVKKLKGKGFSPSIQTRSNKLSRYLVTVGNFADKKSGNDMLKELTRKGYDPSFYKNSNNSFSLKVGQFSSLKESQTAQDNLSIKGFLSEFHKAEVPVKTYMVQLGIFPNKEKARLTQEKLARAGFSKSFIR